MPDGKFLAQTICRLKTRESSSGLSTPPRYHNYTGSEFTPKCGLSFRPQSLTPLSWTQKGKKRCPGAWPTLRTVASMRFPSRFNTRAFLIRREKTSSMRLFISGHRSSAAAVMWRPHPSEGHARHQLQHTFVPTCHIMRRLDLCPAKTHANQG